MSTAATIRAPTAAVHRLWRLALRLRFLLFQRGRHDALVLEEVAGRQIVVLPGVFNPKLFWTGELLARLLDERLVPPASSVLDLGTGTGIGAIAAAQWARCVVAVDVNPAAERCARINVLLNGCEERVEVRGGDLFEPVVGETFDVVVFNPPYYGGSPVTALDRAFRASDVPERFAASLGRHLNPGGHALVLLSSRGESTAFLECLREAGFTVDGVAEERRVGEVLTLYRARRGDGC